MTKNVLYFVLAVAILLLVGGGIYYLTQQQPAVPVTPPVQVEEEPKGLGGDIYEQAQNPADSIPDTNPFEGKANPFEGIQTNPFEEGYTNPFE